MTMTMKIAQEDALRFKIFRVLIKGFDDKLTYKDMKKIVDSLIEERLTDEAN